MRPNTRRFLRGLINLIQLTLIVTVVLLVTKCIYTLFVYTEKNVNFLMQSIRTRQIASTLYIPQYAVQYILKDGSKYITYVDHVISTMIVQDLANITQFSAGGGFANPMYIPNFLWFSLIVNTFLNYIKPDVLEEESKEKPITFKDIVGMKQIKEELKQFIELQDQTYAQKQLKAKKTRAILFTGEPGNGKSLMARALGGELNGSFISVSASEFVELYVGSGPRKVRQIFQHAASMPGKVIIFIDETDSVSQTRGSDRNTERDSTLNQLLVSMDTADDRITVIFASNRIENFDSAFRRRIDITIPFENPNSQERKQLIEYYTEGVVISPDVDLTSIASNAYGYSRAKMSTLVSNAKHLAALEHRTFLNRIDFNEAILQLDMGRPVDNLIMGTSERWRTAFHEAGHAFMFYYYYQKNVFLHPPNYLTIVPRAYALGFVAPYMSDEYQSYSKKYICAYMQVCYGGLTCEKLFFKSNESTGCSSDLAKARSLAEKYVTNGLSSAFGPVGHTKIQENLSINEQNLKFQEVTNLCNINMDECEQIISKNLSIIEQIATAAFHQEVLYKEDLARIIETEKIPDYRPMLQNRIYTFTRPLI